MAVCPDCGKEVLSCPLEAKPHFGSCRPQLDPDGRGGDQKATGG